MEFIDGASRLRGGAKALDVWRLETKPLGPPPGVDVWTTLEVGGSCALIYRECVGVHVCFDCDKIGYNDCQNR